MTEQRHEEEKDLWRGGAVVALLKQMEEDKEEEADL